MYNVLVVDDNKVIRLMLAEMLKKIEEVKMIGECENAIDARNFLKANQVDILFLDVEMPGMTGIELLKLLPEKPLTILVTAKTGYAIEAFELNVVDYLVKPFSISRVILAAEKAIELLAMKNTQVNEINQEHIFIRDSKVIRKILLCEIQWLESKGDYVKIITLKANYVIHSTLKSMEEKLPLNDFVRIHRSYLIPVAKIDYIEDGVAFIQGIPLPVSETYKNGLLKSLRLI